MRNEMKNVTDYEAPNGPFHQLNGKPPIPNEQETVHCGRCYKYCGNNKSSKDRLLGLFIAFLGGAQVWFDYCLYTNDPVVGFLDLKNATNRINVAAAELGMAIGAGWILGGLCLAAGFCSKCKKNSEAIKE